MLIKGKVLYAHRSHSGIVYCAVWSPDGKYIASGGGCTEVQIWKAFNDQHIRTYDARVGHTIAVAWSPDSSRIVSGYHDGTVAVWEVTTGNTLFTYQNKAGEASHIAWSPDGQYIASSGYEYDCVLLQIWNVANAENSVTYRLQEGIYSLAWSPNGTWLAAGGDDGAVRLWNPHTGELVHTYRGSTSQGRAYVNALAWSSDSHYLACANTHVNFYAQNSTDVEVWDIQTSYWNSFLKIVRDGSSLKSSVTRVLLPMTTRNDRSISIIMRAISALMRYGSMSKEVMRVTNRMPESAKVTVFRLVPTLQNKSQVFKLFNSVPGDGFRSETLAEFPGKRREYVPAIEPAMRPIDQCFCMWFLAARKLDIDHMPDMPAISGKNFAA